MTLVGNGMSQLSTRLWPFSKTRGSLSSRSLGSTATVRCASIILEPYVPLGASEVSSILRLFLTSLSEVKLFAFWGPSNAFCISLNLRLRCCWFDVLLSELCCEHSDNPSLSFLSCPKSPLRLDALRREAESEESSSTSKS